MALQERRARAAHSRLALALAFALLTIVGWVLVGVGAMEAWAPILPTAGLAAVLVVGRRVALAQARADIARFGRIPSAQARARAAQPTTPASGRSTVRQRTPSSAALPAPVPITAAELGAMRLAEGIAEDLPVLLDATLDDAAPHPAITAPLERSSAGADLATATPPASAEVGGAAADWPDLAAASSSAEVGGAAGDVPVVEAAPSSAESGAAAGRGWTPVPVPAPAYTLREEAERWEPKPLTEADYEAARDAASRLTAAGPEETGKIALPPRVIFGESAIDIDTAINKRRASS
jgi:hypothetical protein